MTRRILHIVSSGQPSSATAQLRLLLDGLAIEEFASNVAVLQPPDASAPVARLPAATVQTVGRRRAFDLSTLRNLRRSIADVRPDLLHTWSMELPAAGMLARGLRFAGPVVASIRHEPANSAWFPPMVDRWAARPIDHAIVNGAGLVSHCTACGIASSRIEAIADAVEPARDDRSTVRTTIMAALGIPAGSWVLMCAARLEHDSRLKDLFWALDLLRVIRDDMHLVIVGDGSLEASLRQYCRQITVDACVHFVGCRDDLPDWLSATDLYLMPSAPASAPWPLVQAIAAGVPIAAVDSAVMRQLIPREDYGRLVPLGDRAALARAINILLDDAATARSAAQRAAAPLRDARRADTFVAQHAALYRAMLASR